MRNRNPFCGHWPEIKDYGADPLIVNIDRYADRNTNFRTTLWTGGELQVTLMSIPVGGEIGIEMHSGTDQFIRVEKGRALVMMGNGPERLNQQQLIGSQYAVIVPAGTWHNIVNAGNVPLKLYSVYAPPQHPFGTVHPTKEDADREGT